MIPTSDALRIILSHTKPVSAEPAPLREALGRVLAQVIVSDLDVPPFSTSAMDGYAIREQDVAAPGTRLPERQTVVAAGDPPPRPISAGEAVRVMTGAPVRPGTDSIVPIENVHREGGDVTFFEVPRVGAHLRRTGEIFRKGAVLLHPGHRLTPRSLALAAAAGADPVSVHRRPRALLATTGSEVVPVSERPGPGQIRNTNGPMLKAAVERCGAFACERETVPDRPGALARLLSEAQETFDVLITTGAVSAGDFDIAVDEAKRAGLDLLFHRVAIKPGKPIAVAAGGPFLWFGLPGNPVSAAVTFALFVEPALRALEGETAPGHRLIPARLATPLSNPGPRETLHDALLYFRDGEVFAEPLQSRGSHDIACHARADALIILPALAGQLPEGTVVECLPLAMTTFG